jgi:phosphoglycolate phosphatase-like HAD superfamily hydrolase
MIGDGVNDILAAKAARVPVVAVMGGVNTHDEPAAHQPDWLIAGLERLPDIVK